MLAYLEPLVAVAVGALDADRLDDLVIAIEIATAGAPVQFAESPRAT